MRTKRITVKSAIYKGKNISKKTGDALIYTEVVEYFIDGSKSTTKVATIIRVKPEDWDSKAQAVLSSDPEYLYKNDIIDRARRIADYKIQEQLAGREVDSPLLMISDEGMKRFTDYIQDYIDFRKAQDTPRGTLKEFITCKNRILAYEKHIGSRLDFEDMEFQFSDNFCIYLKQQKYSSGTIHKTFSILRTILNHYFERRKKLKIDLSDTFRSKSWKCGKPSRNEPQPLTEEQVDILKNHTFKTDSLNQHKDRFLWQCYTGMRFSDAFNITPDNLDGKYLVFYPEKTKGRKEDNRVELPITGGIKCMLEKYDYNISRLSISNQKYNVGLKDMFDELIEKYPNEFNQRFTSHNGRDTFISISLNNGVEVPMLLKMVGQSSYAVMQRYFKVDRKKMAEKMTQIQIFS